MNRCPFSVSFQDQSTVQFYSSYNKIEGCSQMFLGILIHVECTSWTTTFWKGYLEPLYAIIFFFKAYEYKYKGL